MEAVMFLRNVGMQPKDGSMQQPKKQQSTLKSPRKTVTYSQ
jgi:hypothetical protein